MKSITLLHPRGRTAAPHRRRAAPLPFLKRNFAADQHMAGVGDPQRLLGVLLDHQDGYAPLADVEQQIEDDLKIGRRKARCRLVEQQQFRLAHQRPAHRHHLPLATGQLSRRLTELVP
jgi:hypothetical protein